MAPGNEIDPVNDIPRFSDRKSKPWIEASRRGVASDAGYGTGGEDTLSALRAVVKV